MFSEPDFLLPNRKHPFNLLFARLIQFGPDKGDGVCLALVCIQPVIVELPPSEERSSQESALINLKG